MPDLGDFTEFDAAVQESEKAEPDTFRLHGQRFTIADQVSVIPLMRLAKVVATSNDVERRGVPEEMAAAEQAALLALYDFLEQTLAPGEFDRFCEVATTNRMSDEAVNAVARRIYEVIATRPTTRQPSSSAGLPPTSPDSKPISSALAAAGEQVSAEEAVQLLRAVP